MVRGVALLSMDGLRSALAVGERLVFQWGSGGIGPGESSCEDGAPPLDIPVFIEGGWQAWNRYSGTARSSRYMLKHVVRPIPNSVLN